MAKNETITIKRMLLKNYIEIHNISGNTGIPFSVFMKETLKKITEKYSDELKQEVIISPEIKDSVRVYRVPKQANKDIKNICGNIGCDISSFLKIELKKMAQEYPSHLKKTPLDY